MSTSSISNQKTIEQIVENTASKAKERKTGELGKDEFLNLLVTQLRYQDPLNPVDDKQFIGQMAQFSALEQMQNMNASFSSTKAFSLIGKYISASIVDEKTKNAKAVEGVVSSVKMSEGKAFVVVNGQDIPVDKVTDISDASSASMTNLATYTNLIGYEVKGSLYDGKTGDVIGVSGVVKEIQKGLNEDYAVMDGVALEISDINTETKSTDPNYIINYLKEQKEKGEEVSVVAVDRKNDLKVAVKALLGSYTEENGKVSVVLNHVNVPVDSVSNIKPTSKTSSTP